MIQELSNEPKTIVFKKFVDTARCVRVCWPISIRKVTGTCDLNSVNSLPSSKHFMPHFNHRRDYRSAIYLSCPPPCHDAGPLWKSQARGCGVCGANVACVHHHTPRQTLIYLSYFTFCRYFASVFAIHTMKYETLTIHFLQFIQILCFI